MWWALEGKGKKAQRQPVRKGAKYGLDILDLGDADGLAYRITRRFSINDEGETTETLKLEDADGAKPRSPQAIIDSLLGRYTLDPIAFANGKPEDRIDTLRRLIPGFDFEAAATRRQELYDGRTDVNREIKRLSAMAYSINVPEDAPEKLIDTKPLMDAIAKAGEAARAHAAATSERDRARDAIEQKRFEAEQKDTRIAELRAAIMTMEEEAKQLRANADAEQAALDALAPLPLPPDTEDLRAKIDDAEARNKDHALKAQRDTVLADLKTQTDKSASLTKKIVALDEAQAKALTEAELPARGLSFGEDDVYLNGVPFDQASDAERLRASMAIAMASEPKLRVIRVRDGNGLDANAMAVIREVAETDDWQVWMERVVPSGPTAVILEDGMVKK